MNEHTPISAFCHIIKASGTTVTSILRRNYGLRHLDTQPARGRDEYQLSDMHRDLSLLPRICSLSGHGLRPYIDYGPYAERLVWFTWLREPVSRLISGYQHGIEKRGIKESFEEWLAQPGHRNRLVYTLSGTEDGLEKAKDILKDKIKFVGLLERFDESLILLKHKMEWRDFNIDYLKPANIAKKGQVKETISRDMHKYKSLIDDSTLHDQELYEWVVNELYPLQIESYGKERLQRDLLSAFPRASLPIKEKVNESVNNMFRKFVYRPYILVRK